MSIFSKALEYLTGKQKEKEFKEKLVNGLDELLKRQIPQEFIIKTQEPECKVNKIIFNANNGSLQVITCSGDTFQGFGVTWEIAQKCKTATTEEIIALLTPPKVEEKTEENNIEQEEKEIVSNFLDIFENTDDFEVVGNSVFFKSIRSVEIPSLIVARFVELIEQISYFRGIEVDEHSDFNQDDKDKLTSLESEYQSLKAFTLKLLLNPLKESREHALQFVRKFDIKLTNTGNMIMYRRIVSKDDSNKHLVEFVSKQYLKVKSWKKSPKNFTIGKNQDGTFAIYLNSSSKNWETVGNLAELYNNLSELKENRYTDDYTKSYDIRIGATYKIREEDIDLNKKGSCGGALHVADGKVFSYSAFGDTPVCCIVNPMHIYKMDSGCSGKIGVRQMFIAAVTTQDENGNYEDIDNQDLVNFDELYHNESLEELQQALKTKSLQATSVSTAMSEVSLKDVENISNILKNRVVTI